MAPTVRNVKSTDLSPKLKLAPGSKVADKLTDLLPRTLTPKRIEFELGDVSTAVANGLRRTCALEINAKSMTFDQEDFETTNPFILPDFLRQRIEHIPIEQSVSNSTEWYIDVVNNTKHTKYIYSNDIKMRGGKGASGNTGKDVFNQTFPIISLQPNTSLKVKKIYIHEGLGYINSCFSLACQTACVPVDQKPIDLTTKEGVRSGVANARKHRISFVTNGGISGKEIVARACQSIRERLRYIQTLLPNITTKEGMSMLAINGESDTIGNLLLKTVTELSPDTVITYEPNSTYRALTLKLKTQEEPDRVINNAIKVIIEIYGAIEKQIK